MYPRCGKLQANSTNHHPSAVGHVSAGNLTPGFGRCQVVAQPDLRMVFLFSGTRLNSACWQEYSRRFRPVSEAQSCATTCSFQRIPPSHLPGNQVPWPEPCGLAGCCQGRAISEDRRWTSSRATPLEWHPTKNRDWLNN